MLKAILAATAMTAVLATAAVGKETPAATANACAREANAGHETAWRLEPSLRSTIESHRARMSEICTKLATASGSKAALLEDCLAEAAKGPRHIQRGRNMDRDHVARQKDLCRKLAS